MNDPNKEVVEFRGWFRHENGQEYSMLVKGVRTFEGAAAVCSVEEDAGGVRCMRIERILDEEYQPTVMRQFEISSPLAKSAARLIYDASPLWGPRGKDGSPQIESLRIGISGAIRRSLAGWVKRGNRPDDLVVTREGAPQTGLAMKLMYVMGLRSGYDEWITRLGLELVSFLDEGGRIFGKDWELISDESGIAVGERIEKSS